MPTTPRPPVIRVTRYELVSSLLTAIVLVLCVVVMLLGSTWYARRQPKPHEPVAVELIENPGGSEDGVVGETLRVESPAELSRDASPAEIASDVTEIQASLDSVLGSADDAVNLTPTSRQFELGTGTQNTGKVGSATGTGRRALGSGPGEKGFPREQRWFIRYADQQTVEEYARQLDFFGVELGAIVSGKLVYLSKLSAAAPATRTVSSGAGETRLYMTWQGGSRKIADLQMFQKAGINVGVGVILQFYPKETENRLALLERDYKKRRADEIRRTYFAVRPAEGGGYEFYVTGQTYFN